MSSARVRVLASYVVLLALSGVASMIAIRTVLVLRLEDRTRDALRQEVLELRELVAERPSTGRDPRRAFDLFLTQNVPSEDEALLFFTGGRPYRSDLTRFPLDRLPEETTTAWARVSAGVGPGARGSEGDFESSLGTGYFGAVPVGPDGLFVVAILPEDELSEIGELQSIGFVVVFIIVVLASLLAWIATQRAFRPLRRLSETAAAISDSDLTRRLPVGGGTEETEMARAFNAMLDRLEAVVRGQREFLQHASHELRVPLTIGIGQLDVLLHTRAGAERTIPLVIDELTRGGRIVDGLRLLAESELPDFARLEPLELGGLSDGLIARVESLAPRRWVLEARGEGMFVADRDRLTQAVLNLADNAAHHTSEGDVIALGTAADGSEVRLWVRDEGPGVPESDRDRIFERFERGSGAHRRYRGAGLGLAIVRGRGGPLRSRRALRRRARRRRVRRRHPAARTGARSRREMSRVLIVEDDALVADFVSRGLEAHGHSARVTDEAGPGAALALSGDFDLVILDIGLPGDDGFTLLDQVRGQGGKVPIIVLTGRPDLRDAVDALNHGADDYMTKPFRFDELLARVGARLRRTGADRPAVLSAGDVTLDLRARRTEVAGVEVELTAREFTILEMFVRHPGQVLSREQLLSHVWGYFFEPGTNVVTVHVASLRRKLGPDRIETVRGTGYRLRS